MVYLKEDSDRSPSLLHSDLKCRIIRGDNHLQNLFQESCEMKSFTSILLAIVLFTGVSLAGTGFFGPASVLKKGKFLMGAEGKYFLEGNDQLGLLGHARYGLAPRFGLGADIGLIRSKNYFSGYLDYQLLYDRPGSIGLTMRVGAYSSSDSGLRAALMMGNQFRFGSLYGGLDWSYSSDAKQSSTNLLGGIHLPIQNRVAFVGEIGFNINDQNQSSYLSGGVLYYF